MVNHQLSCRAALGAALAAALATACVSVEPCPDVEEISFRIAAPLTKGNAGTVLPDRMYVSSLYLPQQVGEMPSVDGNRPFSLRGNGSYRGDPAVNWKTAGTTLFYACITGSPFTLAQTHLDIDAGTLSLDVDESRLQERIFISADSVDRKDGDRGDLALTFRPAQALLRFSFPSAEGSEFVVSKVRLSGARTSGRLVIRTCGSSSWDFSDSDRRDIVLEADALSGTEMLIPEQRVCPVSIEFSRRDGTGKTVVSVPFQQGDWRMGLTYDYEVKVSPSGSVSLTSKINV